MRGPLAMLFAAGAVMALCGVARAQNVQPQPPGVTHPSVAPPSSATPPPEQVAPGALSGHQTLSDKLATQNGTLAPPSGVDPKMPVKKPPQTASTMPVIPPPGTNGGNKQVVPK